MSGARLHVAKHVILASLIERRRIMTEPDIQELAFEALDWHTKPDLCADIRAGRGSADMRERFASACAGVKVGLAHAEARLEALESLPARIRSQTNAVKSYMTIGGIGGYAGAAEKFDSFAREIERALGADTNASLTARA